MRKISGAELLVEHVPASVVRVESAGETRDVVVQSGTVAEMDRR